MNGESKRKAANSSKNSLNHSSSRASKYLMQIKEGSVPFSFPNLGWALKNRPEQTLDVNQSPVDRINFLCQAPDQQRMDGLYSITRSSAHKERMKGLFGTYFGSKSLNMGSKAKGDTDGRLGTPRSKEGLKNWRTIIELEICHALNPEPAAMGACIEDSLAAPQPPTEQQDDATTTKTADQGTKEGVQNSSSSPRPATNPSEFSGPVVRALEEPPAVAEDPKPSEDAREAARSVRQEENAKEAEGASALIEATEQQSTAVDAETAQETQQQAPETQPQAESESPRGGTEEGTAQRENTAATVQRTSSFKFAFKTAASNKVVQPGVPHTAPTDSPQQRAHPSDAEPSDAASGADASETAQPAGSELASSQGGQGGQGRKDAEGEGASGEEAKPDEAKEGVPTPSESESTPEQSNKTETDSKSDESKHDLSKKTEEDQQPQESTLEESQGAESNSEAKAPPSKPAAVSARSASFKFNFKRVGSQKQQEKPAIQPLPPQPAEQEDGKQEAASTGTQGGDQPTVVSDVEQDPDMDRNRTPEPVPSEHDFPLTHDDGAEHPPETVASRPASALSSHAAGVEGVEVEAAGADRTPEYTPAGSPEPDSKPRTAERTPEYTPCETPTSRVSTGAGADDNNAGAGGEEVTGERRRWPSGQGMRRLRVQEVVKISGAPLSERVTRTERLRIIKQAVAPRGAGGELEPRPPSGEASFNRRKRWWSHGHRHVGASNHSMSSLPDSGAGGGQRGRRSEEGEGVTLPMISPRHTAAEVQGAVRQCLQEIFETAQEAYVFLDIRTCGELSVNDFRRGWERLRIYHIAADAAFNALLPEKDFKSFARSYGWHPVHNYNQALFDAQLVRKSIDAKAMSAVSGRPFRSAKSRAAAAEQPDVSKSSRTQQDCAVQAIKLNDIDPLHSFQAALQLYFADAAEAFCFLDAKGCGHVSKAEFERACHKLLIFEIHTDGAMDRLDSLFFDKGPLDALDFLHVLSWSDIADAEAALDAARSRRPAICAHAINVACSRTPLAESVARNRETYQVRRSEGQRRLASIQHQKQQMANPRGSVDADRRVPIRPRKYSPLTPMGRLQEALKDIFVNSAEAFVFFDTSGNNFLSESEIQHALKRLGAPEEWTTELLWSMDKDVRDGAVDAFEFVKYLSWGQLPDFFDALKDAQNRRRDIIIKVTHSLRRGNRTRGS